MGWGIWTDDLSRDFGSECAICGGKLRPGDKWYIVSEDDKRRAVHAGCAWERAER